MTAPDLALPSLLLAPVCAHHWQLESPHGEPTVHGICKRCGAERDFPASEPPPVRIGHLPGISEREAIHHVD